MASSSMSIMPSHSLLHLFPILLFSAIIISAIAVKAFSFVESQAANPSAAISTSLTLSVLAPNALYQTAFVSTATLVFTHQKLSLAPCLLPPVPGLTSYTFFHTTNQFTVLGCDTIALIKGTEGLIYTSGCISLSNDKQTVTNGSCSGIGCCQTAIPEGLNRFETSIGNLNINTWSFNPCIYAFMADKDRYTFEVSDLSSPGFISKIRRTPVVFDWAIGNQTCRVAQTEVKSYACANNTDCYDSENGQGYQCSCYDGYQGNPYLKVLISISVVATRLIGGAWADDAPCVTPTWIINGLTCVCFKQKENYERIGVNLIPRQESLRRLRHRMQTHFDKSRPNHQDALRALWHATHPDQELGDLISGQWKKWDGGEKTSYQSLLKKQGGKGVAWEYPFAVAGVNIAFMIMQMLDLDSSKHLSFFKYNLFALKVLETEAYHLGSVRNPEPFSEQYFYTCYQKTNGHLICFIVWLLSSWTNSAWKEMSHIWSSAQDLKDILKCTRTQLEKELLMDDILRIEDMPSYALLVNIANL